jgi:predicted cupin superfamily sugar epimerase
MLTSSQIKEWLQLQHNNDEGGYFASTYVSDLQIPSKDLLGFPNPPETRAICSAIFYFIDSGGFSAMHRVTSDMIYHFYTGQPVQMLLLYPDGSPNRSEVCIFSNDLAAGGIPMKVIPAGTWLGSRLLPGGDHALMGVSMAPGFDPSGYAIARRADLLKTYNSDQEQSLITALTRA